MYRLAILNTHPIQYFAPLYRRLAQEAQLDLTVYFCSHQGAERYVDTGFGEELKWDVPLVEGYKHKFLTNLRRRDQVNGFFSLVNPAVVDELRQNRYDALIVNGHNHLTYVLAMAAAKLVRTPVLMRCDTHLNLKRSVLKRAIRKPLMRFLYTKVCFGCLPIGIRNRDFYRAHGVNEDRMFKVPFAVDNSFFSQAVDKLRVNIEPIKSELGVP